MIGLLYKFLAGLKAQWILSILTLLCFCGCGDFFAQKPIELQTREILTELEQVKESPHIKNPLPEIYRSPAKRLKIKDKIKLFYFTRQHDAEEIAGIITSQLGNKNTPNPSTNQVIIDCANDEEADNILEFLEMVDVPPIQVNIHCLILERFADVTMDWETTIWIENFLGEKITLGGKTDPSGNLLPAFPGASLREAKRSTFGLDFGYWKNKGITGHEFRAVVDVLVSRGYLKILMNPTLEIVNGKTGRVSLRDFAPLEMLVTEKNILPYSLTKYQWVEDFLEVTPHVFGDGSIGLKTSIQLGSRSKPEGVVQTSILTERTISIEENRIKPGNSLIIGGVRKTEKRAVIRGVPFLKDIPIIGILFSSKDTEEKSTEVVFILTPSISSGGIDHIKMIEGIREKFAPPKYKRGLGEVITDPLGIGAYTEQVKRKAAEAEFERFKTEIEKTEAIQETEKALAEKAEAEEAKTEAEKAKAEAEKAKAEAEAETQKAKEEVVKAKAETLKAKEEVVKAKAEVEAKTKSEAQAQKAKTEAEKAKAEAEAKAKADAEAKAKAEAETKKAKEETQAAKAEAEKAKAEAEKSKSDDSN